jgi:hypothetical protein
MRVCQFRHDGNLDCNAAAALRPPSQEDQPFYFTGVSTTVKPTLTTEARRHGATEKTKRKKNNQRSSSASLCLRAEKHFCRIVKPYPSFAVIEIFAFSTFDTGQPFSAASAYF